MTTRHEKSLNAAIVAILAAVATCGCVASTGLTNSGALPQPGTYEIVIEANEGSGKGTQERGILHLYMARETDRSTQEDLRAIDLGEVPHSWGYTTISAEAVGIPLCGDQVDLASKDPIFPGALLLAPSTIQDRPVLLLGTASNRRDGTLTSDGCGVGLFLEEWSSSAGRGRWKEWGIARDGRGTFEIRRLDPQ